MWRTMRRFCSYFAARRRISAKLHLRNLCRPFLEDLPVMGRRFIAGGHVPAAIAPARCHMPPTKYGPAHLRIANGVLACFDC
jgi:hypothetical protein